MSKLAFEHFITSCLNPKGNTMLKKIFLLLLVPFFVFFVSHKTPAQHTLVSSNPTGTVSGNDWSSLATQSADGRFIAFESRATNLLPNANNSHNQIYVRDMKTGVLELVSVNHSGQGAANEHSFTPQISADGRHVAFYSEATDLVQSTSDIQISNQYHLFVRDLETGTTHLVSLPKLPRSQAIQQPSFVPGAQISSNGRFVAFEGQVRKSRTQYGKGQTEPRVFVWDKATGESQQVSTNVPLLYGVDIRSYLLAMTPDGRFIVFRNRNYSSQLATEITPFLGIFIRDMISGEIEPITVRVSNLPEYDSHGGNARISDNGQYVVFEHRSKNLTNIPDNNNELDIFIRDRTAQTTRLITSNSAQTASGYGNSWLFSVSSDGRFVVFGSNAQDLIPNQTVSSNRRADVFVWDALNNTKICASVDIPRLGIMSNGYLWAGISNNGENIMMAAMKHPRDNAWTHYGELFVLNTVTGRTNLISNLPGSASIGDIGRPSISRDGSRIVFQTNLPLLLTDNNNNDDIYSYTLPTGNRNK